MSAENFLFSEMYVSIQLYISFIRNDTNIETVWIATLSQKYKKNEFHKSFNMLTVPPAYFNIQKQSYHHSERLRFIRVQKV